MSNSGRNVYDISKSVLSHAFNKTGRTDYPLPAELYGQFLQTYESVESFCSKFREVLYSKHFESLVEACRAHFRLPERNFMRQEVNSLGETLYSFNPEASKFIYENQYALLAKSQLEGYFNTFSQTSEIISKMGRAYQETDYVAFAKLLREQGYRGPSCTPQLKEVIQILSVTSRKQESYITSMPFRKN